MSDLGCFSNVCRQRGGHCNALRGTSLTLLDILLDVRYEINRILTSNPKSGPDPVKQLFIRSWERLEPACRGRASIRRNKSAAFLSFLTAADALKALDQLGPAAGLDISTDGLRRLARLLNDNPSIDPLKSLPVEIDPVLQQLFEFGNPQEITPPKKKLVSTCVDQTGICGKPLGPSEPLGTDCR